MPGRSAYMLAASNVLLAAIFVLQAACARDRLHSWLFTGAAVAISIAGATFSWAAARGRSAT
ncbi:hypothetical protein [Sphingomonas elodea]|uniref:hypothetical protein n=1 Tax=Sphingomonas elodea TaxID=179878 RepID=UPI000263215A|nr:hypothetical protein [Sphingomonas elodea]